MRQRLLTALVIGFAFVAALPAQAGTLRYPESGAGFVINEPPGWTHRLDNNGGLVLAAPNDVAWVLFLVGPDKGGTIDEEAASFASTLGAGRPTNKTMKVISGHFGYAYDVSMSDPARGRVNLHFAIVALEGRRYLSAVTIVPAGADPARRGEARAIFDSLTINDGRP